ncbi:MAG TPA: Ig-like domain-containing protein [Sediminibacterium sp.]|nr:Ig-like domain-containing protein [Sediminibacterium sp.]
MKQTGTILLLLLLWLAGVLSFSSCANIIPPTGGPRDSLPPRLVLSNPHDSALNVKTRNIVLTFDEYINLENINQNLIVSPNPKQFPQVDYKLRNLTIKLKDSLQPNTTYSFDFGNGVKDVNEGNIARNLQYCFSTGSQLDNFSYSGTVMLAETGKTDSTLLVTLYRNLSDTAVRKLSPLYYTRIDGKGAFHFRHLPAGRYAVYVIPKNYFKRYEDSTQLFAFRDGPVTVSESTPGDTLYAFEEYRKTEEKSSSAARRPAPRGKEDKRLLFATNAGNGTRQDVLGNFEIKFSRPLGRLDSTGFILADTFYHPLTGYHLQLDSIGKTLTIQYPWKTSQHFALLLNKAAIADTGGIQLSKSDTIRFATKSDADYGSIRIRFTGLDFSRHPVLQTIKEDKLVASDPLQTPQFYRKLYEPGIYQYRILYDTNQNGVWDTGMFLHGRRQPEIVIRIPKQVAIRENWDNEVDLGL